MNSIEKYKKDGATILTWTNDADNEIDYAKMEGGHILIKFNKLTTSIRLYGINQKIAIVGAKCLHNKIEENIINISNFYGITLTPDDNTIDYVNYWGDEPILNANYIEISLTNPDTDIGQCFLILDYMVI
jgi:hypothetical protein